MLKVFFILIGANVKYKIKWKVKPGFAIGLHKKDIDLLKKIKACWGVGKINKHGKDSFKLVRGYHSLTTSSISPNRLHPRFITGFAESESSFSGFAIKKNKN